MPNNEGLEQVPLKNVTTFEQLKAEEEVNKKNAKFIFWLMVILFGAAFLITGIELWIM